MRLSKPIKPKVITPVQAGIGFKCPCGNRLCENQKKCEICEAIVDWTGIENKGFEVLEELKRKKYKWNK